MELTILETLALVVLHFLITWKSIADILNASNELPRAVEESRRVVPDEIKSKTASCSSTLHCFKRSTSRYSR